MLIIFSMIFFLKPKENLVDPWSGLVEAQRNADCVLRTTGYRRMSSSVRFPHPQPPPHTPKNKTITDVHIDSYISFTGLWQWRPFYQSPSLSPVIISTLIHVSVSSNSLFEGRPSRIRPPDLQFSIFAVLSLFIVVTCRSQSDLYLPTYILAIPVFR